MKAYFQDNTRAVYNKSCHDMSELPDNSIHCVVTSPPYHGLRKYAGEQEIKWADGDVSAFGLEKNIVLYVQHTIEILREIRRVLRPDGCCFYNVGDSYATHASGGKGYAHNFRQPDVAEREGIDQPKPTAKSMGLKEKDLCLIPFRVAIAAQADGWYVRSVIIWSKNNPMPESVKDRPTESHEYIIMLTKSARYFWDAEAVREPLSPLTNGFGVTERGRKDYSEDRGSYKTETFKNTYGNPPNGRNLRSVWTMSTQPYPKSHFATFPEKLPETCIKAATSEAGVCPKCGKQWERIVEKAGVPHDGETACKNYDEQGNSRRLALMRQAARERGEEYSNQVKTLGWRAACTCNAGPAIPATVLDPFCGSGTTLLVATRLGRKSIGYDISTDYMDLIIDRNRQQALVPAAYQKKLEE